MQRRGRSRSPPGYRPEAIDGADEPIARPEPASFDSQRFLIREYRPEDNEACQDLERHAAQGAGRNSVKGRLSALFFQAHSTHVRTFEAKARQFPRSHVLVCVDTAAGARLCAVVGVVMVGIKPATLRGQPATLGYMFDLRVHERVQRLGIGLRLCKLAEERCRADGVHVVYLTVNTNNPRAQRVYTKLGYSLASKRAPTLEFAFRDRRVWPSEDGTPAPGTSIARLSGADAARALVALVGTDCALDELGMRHLADDECYEGGYVAESDDGSSATLHLWNSSSLGGFSVTRLLLPVRWLEGAMGTVLGALAAAAIARAAWLCATRAISAYLAGAQATALAILAAGLAAGWIGLLAAPYLAFARRILLKSGRGHS